MKKLIFVIVGGLFISLNAFADLASNDVEACVKSNQISNNVWIQKKKHWIIFENGLTYRVPVPKKAGLLPANLFPSPDGQPYCYSSDDKTGNGMVYPANPKDPCLKNEINHYATTSNDDLNDALEVTFTNVKGVIARGDKSSAQQLHDVLTNCEGLTSLTPANRKLWEADKSAIVQSANGGKTEYGGDNQAGGGSH